MRDKNYRIKAMRLSEEVWNKLNVDRKRKGLTWNLYLKYLYEKINQLNK